MKKDPYLVLGLTRTDDKDKRKKAYQRLRSKHHPDKGGDAVKFNEIEEAWEEIKDDPVLKPGEEYERTVNFRSAHFSDGFFHNRRSNQFVNIDTNISIGKAVAGGDYSLQIQLSHTEKPYVVSIHVPPGVRDGESINYPRMLLNMIDLNVTFHIDKDAIWSLDGMDITKKEVFDIWDLILGTQRDVKTIKNTMVRVTIPPMTQPGTKLRLRSYGAPNRNNFMQKGDMYVEIQARIPNDIPEEILTQIKALKS